jgi:polysaccharide deacetylase 2 family uncharacterized protein YibQ
LCLAGAVALWLWPSQPAADAVLAPPAAPATTAAAAADEDDAQAAVPVPAEATAAPVAAATAPPPTPAPAPSAPQSPLPVPSAVPALPEERPAKPRLAIIIDDCGQWPDTEHGFVALPFPVTLSVLPHVRFGPAIARDANAAGKGVMLHLPMQTVSGRYPGPGTITITMGDAAIRGEVAGDLAELPEARGVNNHEGSLATQDPRVMGDVIEVLAQDGRFFIDSRTSSASIGESVARERGVPTAGRSVFLDNVDNEAAVEARLREAVRDALATGSAIAIGHPRPATLAAVRNLGPTFAADGVQLTLASDLVH